MKSEIDIICDVSEKMETLKIPYMLTGSIAMNYYAEPRMTRDIDLVVVIGFEHVKPLVSVFSKEYYIEESCVKEAIQYVSMFNILHLDSVIKVDCIVRKSSEYRQLEFERRKRITINGMSIYIVSKEDLILSKLFWAKASHSEFQLRDVRNLMATGYDREYVNKWKDSLGVDNLLNELKNE